MLDKKFQDPEMLTVAAAAKNLFSKASHKGLPGRVRTDGRVRAYARDG